MAAIRSESCSWGRRMRPAVTFRKQHALRPNSVFVFQQVHNILINVPAESIVAMYNAVRESE